MRILLIDTVTTYYAGAEKMLGYFLEGLKGTDCEVAVAYSRGSRIGEMVEAAAATPIPLDAGEEFSGRNLVRQRRSLRGMGCEIVHGWTARDWEVAALAAFWTGAIAVGTLHDHPKAPFISTKRRQLMRLSAHLGLRRVICVSEAVRRACLDAWYPKRKLTVIRNGLDLPASVTRSPPGDVVRLGYIGAISRRKGLDDLFAILDRIGTQTARPWELAIAGEAQNEDGSALIAEISRDYGDRGWWDRVRWHGWVADPSKFLASLDLLVFPSRAFDPFPTVLLEAGNAGVPVLACDVGGVGEIVRDGETGWLVAPGDVERGAEVLAGLLRDPDRLFDVGSRAQTYVQSRFTLDAMVSAYRRVYGQCRSR